MRTIILVALGLPYAAADACLSVVSKTRLITSVVTTTITSTIPAVHCTTETGISSFASAESSSVTSINDLPTAPSFTSSSIVPISSVGCADCSSIHSTDLESTIEESSVSTSTGNGHDSTSSIQTLSIVTTPILPTASEHTIGTFFPTNTSSYESVTSQETSAEHQTSGNFLTSTIALPSSSTTASETLSTRGTSSCEGDGISCSTPQPTSISPPDCTTDCDVSISMPTTVATTVATDSTAQTQTTAALTTATSGISLTDSSDTSCSSTSAGTAQTEVSSTSCDSTIPGSSSTTTSSISSCDSTTTTTTDDVTSTSSCDTTESTKAATSTLLSTQASDATSQSRTLSEDTPGSTVTSSKTTKETESSSLSQVPTTQAATTTSTEIIARTTSSETSTSSAPTETNLIRSYPADIVDELQDDSMVLLKEYLERNPPKSGCTIENASVRREWGDLSRAQRQAYTDAVLCLQNEPSKSGSQVPGARSRFDDFVGTHILQTDWIHGTANFLSWHRYFIFEFEKALKAECGYEGAMPYWNWDRYAGDLASSPLFNGDDASISGGSVNGNCVTTGPFKDMTVSLGPGNSVQYNPRCLVRELSNWWSAKTKVDATYPLIAQSNNVGEFQDKLQRGDGVHAGGHFSIGGNPGGDIYSSPGDPYFHLHHAMVDRVWWIWQMQNLDSRLFEVQGYDNQARRDGTASDKVNLGVNGPSVEIGSLLDTMGGLNGELCYIYF